MTILSNKLIMLSLEEYVYGHSEAKKALITMLQRSRMRHFQKYIKCMDNDFLVSPMKILLIAGSGIGKTHLLESLQKIVHFPLVKIDATHMNPMGSSGGVKVNDLKKMFLREAERCLDMYPYEYFSVDGCIDRMVCFVDEFDKLGTSFESSGNWNKHVQSNFLTTFDNKDELAGVSFVFAGAFDNITQKVKKAASLGFSPDNREDKKELIDVRVLRSGLIPEIVGRMNYIVEMDQFTKEQFYNILVERVLPKKQLDLAAYHIFDVDVGEENLRRIAQEAEESGQGVRYLNRALDKIFLDMEYEADLDSLIFSGA